LPTVALQQFDSTRALPPIEGVVLEALRLKPVAPVNIFSALQDTELCGTRIPQRTLVCLLTRPPAIDPGNFAQPLDFRPQRWLAGEAAASGSGSGSAPSAGTRRAFAPFGGGPRFCPGRYLALLEAKMALAMALAAFELEPTESPVAEEMGLTMQPKGLKLMLKALSTNSARAQTDQS
jgi:cytochrome P450